MCRKHCNMVVPRQSGPTAARRGGNGTSGAPVCDRAASGELRTERGVVTSASVMNAVSQSTLANRIRDHLGGAEVEVTGEGNRFDVYVASPAFEGLSRVRRQQLVYEAIGDLIRDGTVHAVTIRTVAAGER